MVFGKKNQTEGQLLILRSLTTNVYVNKQASLLASAALTAEVDTLKQNLEQSEQELGRAKKQLEDKEGKKYLV